MTDDWPQIKARLGKEAECFYPCPECGLDPRDIRAALQRAEALERAGLRPEEIAHPFMARAEAAEAKLARVIERFADCIYHHSCEGYEEEGVCEHTRALAAAKGE